MRAVSLLVFSALALASPEALALSKSGACKLVAEKVRTVMGGGLTGACEITGTTTGWPPPLPCKIVSGPGYRCTTPSIITYAPTSCGRVNGSVTLTADTPLSGGFIVSVTGTVTYRIDGDVLGSHDCSLELPLEAIVQPGGPTEYVASRHVVWYYTEVSVSVSFTIKKGNWSQVFLDVGTSCWSSDKLAKWEVSSFTCPGC